MMALLDRGDLSQIAYIFPKDGYQQIRHAGLRALRSSIVANAPELADSHSERLRQRVGSRSMLIINLA